MSSVIAVIRHEIKEVAFVTAYFFGAFAVIGLVTQLFALEYGVRITTVARIAIGALVIGKVVIVLDKISGGRWFAHLAVFKTVMLRSAVYTAAVALVSVAEMLFHGYRETGTLAEALNVALHEAALSRGAAKAVLVFLSFVGYGLYREIAQTVGPKRMKRFLFDDEGRTVGGPTATYQNET
ncbi:MAG: hypothetical protein ACFB9M_05350 [Myxococcota bacterium]